MTILYYLDLFARDVRCSCGSPKCQGTPSRIRALIRELRAALRRTPPSDPRGTTGATTPKKET